jgi:hypothetical protein
MASPGALIVELRRGGGGSANGARAADALLEVREESGRGGCGCQTADREACRRIRTKTRCSERWYPLENNKR